MARKVFLSFLGTGNYKVCKYVSPLLGESEVVEFVQNAIYSLACKEFTSNDCVYIFLTKDAELKHWSSLQPLLEQHNASVIPVKEIPEGYSENEIWKIFDKVFEVIQNNDEIILDITHGFRSMPMLAMVLMNYAKALKNISVKGVYYGAFEALGQGHLIEKEIPNPENRKVPLLDLMAFSSLQDWTFAAQSFIKTGNPTSIVNLTNLSIKPILIETGGKDYAAGKLRQLINSLKKGEREIATNRGKLIQKSTNILIAKKSINELLQDPNSVLAPLRPLLQIIYSKIEKFDSAAYANWEASVDWCITHGLEQQGITQLQEGIISFICNDVELNDANLTHREIVSQAVNIYAFDIIEDDWREPACLNKETVRKIILSQFVISNKNNYNKLTELRNDINHGGYKQHSLSDSSIFSERLREIFLAFRSLTKPTA